MLDITPKCKIAEVIEAYPQLQEKIIALAPAFKKLQNPLLRKTVARITSLSQAAKVGELNLLDFVNELRSQVGQAPLQTDMAEKSSDEPPFWFKTGTIVKTIEARPMLERGEHPLSLVLQEIQTIEAGQILELITNFLPAPLIDKVESKEYHSWTLRKSAEEFRTFFTPKEARWKVTSKSSA